MVRSAYEKHRLAFAPAFGLAVGLTLALALAGAVAKIREGSQEPGIDSPP